MAIVGKSYWIILLIVGFHSTAYPGFKPWLGQTPPGTEPSLFSPRIISTGLYERDLTVTPDGKEIFFGLMGTDYSVIAHMRWNGARWVGPLLVPFTAKQPSMDIEPALSPDGKRLFFLSTRPVTGPAKPGWEQQDIWVVDRTDTGWGTPKPVDPPVNTADAEYYPSITCKGTLYFTRQKTGTEQSAIFRSRPQGKGWMEPEKLPSEINTGNVFNAYIAPDESYLLFCASDRPGCLGKADYFVCFRSPDDQWSAAVNLGEKFNGADRAAISISISPDGHFVFFASTLRNHALRGDIPTYDGFIRERNSPQNGNSDIYWVDATFLDALRPKKSPTGK